MNRSLIRGFQTTSRTLICYIGASLEEVVIENGYQAIIAQTKIPGYMAAEEGDNLEEL